MTPVERGLSSLRPVLGERLSERIRSNLPSRKPQLWERFPKTLLKRTYIGWRARFGQRFPPGPVLLRLEDFDILVECSPRDRLIDLPLFLYGVYEISGTRFLREVVKPGSTVIDVGANSGYYSLIAASLTGARGHVCAFEPVAEPFDRLRRNLAHNGFQNITVTRAVVGRAMGRSIVYPSAVANNDGLGSVLPGPSRAVVGEEVPMIDLDHFVQELPDSRVDLVKVDVEGTEAEVFAGAAHLLSRPIAPALLFESFDVGPIAESLTEFGYEVRHVHYSLQNGLEFPRVGEAFDNLFAAYEAPNFVALKAGEEADWFQDISKRSKNRVPTLLRLLAEFA
jgi:FkbM family methyltransferase